MPAGVSWGEYLRFMTAALVFAMAGSQSVHYYYRPLEDFKKLVEEELARKRESQQT